MAIAIETRDCTALGDSDLAEMADLCAISSNAYEVGSLSKQAEAWVLVTEARDNGRLRGFSFCTLERIGGTPCVLVGAGHTCRTTRRDTVLRGMVADQLRRAALSFPDEDVLVGMQINDAGAFEAFKSLHDVVPRPGHKAHRRGAGLGPAGWPSGSASARSATRTASSPPAARAAPRRCSTTPASSPRRLRPKPWPCSTSWSWKTATP